MIVYMVSGSFMVFGGVTMVCCELPVVLGLIGVSSVNGPHVLEMARDSVVCGGGGVVRGYESARLDSSNMRRVHDIALGSLNLAVVGNEGVQANDTCQAMRIRDGHVRYVASHRMVGDGCYMVLPIPRRAEHNMGVRASMRWACRVNMGGVDANNFTSLRMIRCRRSMDGGKKEGDSSERQKA